MGDRANTLELLRDYESRNVTFLDPHGRWPIVWESARGAHVVDEKGRRYLDLTAAFGVAAAGHANRRVVRAGQKQMERLLHAMGDVHPHRRKGELARELSRLTFERWQAGRGKTIFTNSGFEAVEGALKTALLATGRPGVIAFEGGYHGLGYGALHATHRAHFRGPFRRQLAEFVRFVPFPEQEPDLARVERALRRALARGDCGAILVEPVQGRAGVRVPPRAFLPCLLEMARRHGALLIVDEIYTGFGRTGRWFACEHGPVVPDLICLGKALTGGFPLSACVGRAELMDAAWPASTGEAIHTSTYLGHPVGCAMALAQIQEIARLDLVERSRQLGEWLRERLEGLQAKRYRLSARGLGLMAGLSVANEAGQPDGSAALRVITNLLQRGYLLLPEGEHGEVISFTPPLTISQAQLGACLKALARELERP